MPFYRLLPFILVCTTSLAAVADDPSAAATASPRHEVRLAPAAWVQLAARLAEADEWARREFAQIALEALRESYLQEIEASSHETPRSAEKRAKLARWQQATGQLVTGLDRLIVRLAEGAGVGLQVDAARQLVLFIDATPVVFSPPRASAEAAIGRRIVERFCAFNDCSFLDEATRPGHTVAGRPAGAWLLRQEGGPVYETGPGLRCEFGSLRDRQHKAGLCEAVMQELERLSEALSAAHRQGRTIDWPRLRLSEPRGDDTTLLLNAEGDYLRLSLPLLSRLSDPDWQRTVGWLRDRSTGGRGELLLKDTDRLT